MTAYRYMNQWNSWTLRPIGSKRYLGEAEARERYETGGDAFEVIPEPDPVTGIPAWQIRAYTGDGSFTVWHFNQYGVLTRTVGFRLYDGRLFHDEVLDYFYPEGEDRDRRRSKSSSLITTYIKPNGTSKVIYSDVIPGQEHVEEYRNVPIDSYWAERPAFGHWETLANPNYGDTTPTPR
ncbi:MAG: hypothetical protein L0G23_06985 [Ruaniaceae bacterium]|nr:hypothetical protein [Ruaniaceae bacterium]